MISKGTTHNDGVKLATYMTASKDGERAEMWQLRGFAATNIKDAFRDVEIMAGATKCEQPFFHVQVRNREGETLTRQQWELAADRIERMLGLTGQPRAITFHTYEHNNDEHMHVAWSRIDQDTLTAKPLPFFKKRLKKISRELELHFGLEPVTNERKGSIKYAPTKAQDEQARRLGVDVHEVLNTIRDCWDRSDNGRSFQAALDHEGLILAQGDRRGLVVIDQAGGITALGKRILDVSVAKIHDRLSDLDISQLPTVEQARSAIQGLNHDRLKGLNSELAEVQGLIASAERQPRHKATEPVWDRDLANNEWQDAVINAAIEKEKAERQFVEPRKRETRAAKRQAGAGRRKKEWAIMPPQPEPIQTSPEYHIEDAAREATQDKNYAPPKELKGLTRQIMGWLMTLSTEPDMIQTEVKTLSAVLDDKGITLAVVTKDEAERSSREAVFAKAVGNYAPRYKEGEIVAVIEPPREYRRDGEITEPALRVRKLDQASAKIFVAALDKGTELHGIDATIRASNERAQQRSEHWNEIRLENAAHLGDREYTFGYGNAKAPPANRLGKSALRTIGKIFDVVASAFESLLSPALSPEQIHEGKKAVNRREAEAEHRIDFSKYTADTAQQRREQENDREAGRQRDR